MVRVGIAGIGFMGMIHHLAYAQVPGAKVAAIATRDPKKRAGDWRGIQGNFGPPGTEMDLSGIATYADWQELIRNPQIDLVDVCLPPALHAPVACAALEAGKHVLVEKPIALHADDARRMVETARRTGRQLLIGHVLPFFPEYALTRQWIGEGRFGKLLGGHFKRIIDDPQWIPDFFNPETVGGPVVDLHIHDAHWIRLLWGMPRAVFSTGRRRGEVVEFFTSLFLFDDPQVSVTATSGVIRQPGRSFTHGFEIHLERATLVYDFAVLDGQPRVNIPLTVIPHEGKTYQPELPTVDAFVNEMSEAVAAVQRGAPSPLLDGALALDALALCHKQTESVLSGQIVAV